MISTASKLLFFFLLLLPTSALATPEAQTQSQDFSIENHFNPREATGILQPMSWIITIQPGTEWKVKSTTPLKLTLKPNPYVDLKKREFTQKDARQSSPAHSQLVVPFVTLKKGSTFLEAELEFFLCSKTTCKRQRNTLSARLDIP